MSRFPALSTLALLILLGLAPAAPAAPAVGAIRNQLVFYGDWSDADVAAFGQYDLVVLQPGRYHGSNVAAAVQQIRSQGAIVLLYVSIGEDMRTFGNQPALAGDGRGPSYWDDASNSIVYGNRGIASYYLDQWNAAGYESDPANKVPDGVPDRHGSFGAIMVNAGDPAWQAVVLDTCRKIQQIAGADGFFLDTPETADPWRGYGWTAGGMRDLIAAIRREFPAAVLLLNRGLFFFDPNQTYQYASSPRHLVDIVLFESGLLDNDYTSDRGGNGVYHYSPYNVSNLYYLSPKVNAELGRKDSYRPIISVDYAADPQAFPTTHPAIYAEYLNRVVSTLGRVPLLTNRLLDVAPRTVIDHPAPADRSAPQWQNTTVGCKKLYSTPRPFYMTRCETNWSEAELLASPPAPRAGIRKAIAQSGAVTVQWDAATDQTRPVKYNVYWSTAPLDFESANVIRDVDAVPSPDYSSRSFTDGDQVNPYQFTVTGLQNGSRYYFAVRAEDATTGVAAPASGRAGPGGGIEETNAVVLSVVAGSGEIQVSRATRAVRAADFRASNLADRNVVFSFANPQREGRIEILDARGRRVAIFDRVLDERIAWDGRGAGDGVYLVRYSISGRSGAARIVLAR